MTLYEASRRKTQQIPYLKKIKQLRLSGNHLKADEAKAEIPSIVQKHYNGMPAQAEYLFHLCSSDSMIATIDEVDQLFVFNTMATSTGQIWFTHHTGGTQQHKDPETGQSLLRSCTPGSFNKKSPNPLKVKILPTGKIRSAI